MATATSDAPSLHRDPPGRVVVTGASGFVGSALCRGLVAGGWVVRAAQRRPAVRGLAVEVVDFDLGGAVPAGLFDGAGVLIHAGWAMRCRSEREARRVNVEGSRRLFEAARAAGVGRIVFVSSCSAHDRAVSIYGRTKLAVEALLDPAVDLVVRPGLVIGNGGMSERLQNIPRVTGVAPCVFDREGELRVQPIARQDLVRGMMRALAMGVTGRLVLANPQPVALSALAVALAGPTGGRVLRFPLPARWLLAGLRLVEMLGWRPPLGSDNLLGLAGGVVQDSADDLARVGLRPRSLKDLRRPELG